MRKSLLVLALALLLAGCSAAPAGETPPGTQERRRHPARRRRDLP